jgi:hypothetical protein
MPEDQDVCVGGGEVVSEPTKCLRCQGDLKAGFIPDASHSAIFLLSWIEGAPGMRSGWLSAMLGGGWMGKALDIKNFTGRQKLPIVAYRCTSCGTLELRASDQIRWPESANR